MRSNRPTPVAVALALAVVFLAPHVLLAQYAINTVAGGGPKHLTPLNASIGDPVSIALDAADNTYIADYYSSRIFKLDTSSNLTVVAGNGTACSQTAAQCGDGGPATGAALNHPEGVFVDAAGNIFIADTFDFVIRAVNTGTQAVTIAGVTIQPGYIATVAGNGMFGYSGDGGPATSAQLYDPFGVFVDSAENIYIADTDNCLIRKVSGANISTVAGDYASTTPCGYNGDGLATRFRRQHRKHFYPGHRQQPCPRREYRDCAHHHRRSYDPRGQHPNCGGSLLRLHHNRRVPVFRR